MGEPEQVTVIEPTTQPRASQTATGGNCSLVNNFDWDTRIAYAVCMGESGGNVNAANWSDGHNGCKGSFGLMQIACIHGATPETTPEQNMQMAYNIYKRSGWNPWGAYLNGSYQRWL
jgi:hypothetical protein